MNFDFLLKVSLYDITLSLKKKEDPNTAHCTNLVHLKCDPVTVLGSVTICMNPFFNVIQMLWCFHIECLSPCTCCSLQTVLILFYFFLPVSSLVLPYFLCFVSWEKESTNGEVIICVIIKPFYFYVCEVEIPFMDYFYSKPDFLHCRSDAGISSAFLLSFCPK